MIHFGLPLESLFGDDGLFFVVWVQTSAHAFIVPQLARLSALFRRSTLTDVSNLGRRSVSLLA